MTSDILYKKLQGMTHWTQNNHTLYVKHNHSEQTNDFHHDNHVNKLL